MTLGLASISASLPLADVLGLNPVQQGMVVVIFLILVAGLFASATKVGGFAVLFHNYLGDITRYSLGRTWAISIVCYRESIRKRVLWVIPLAIAVVLVVSSLQKAVDEQDAIRQTTKYCLFASGMVVVLTSIILACTSLPKEIESKVIFTIVTKPCTRLEIVLGKIIGFARVSGTILLIMGVFAWVYLSILAGVKERDIDYKLREADLSQTEKYRLTRYQQVGLLNAASYTQPAGLEMVARPVNGVWNRNSPTRSVLGLSQQDIVEQFPVDADKLFPLVDGQYQGVGASGLVLRAKVKWTRTGDPDEEPDVFGPQEPTKKFPPPAISIEVMDENHFLLLGAERLIGAADAGALRDAIIKWNTGKQSATPAQNTKFLRLPAEDKDGYVYAYVPPQQAIMLRQHPAFYVRILGLTQNAVYTCDHHPIDVFVPVFDAHTFALDEKPATPILPTLDAHGQPLVLSQGSPGVHGEQTLKAGPDATGVAVYHFSSAKLTPGSDGNFAFEIIPTIERMNSDVEEGREDPTLLNISVYDIASGQTHTLAEPTRVESRLTSFFDVPSAYITGGDFELIMGCPNPDQSVLLYPRSVQAIASREYFALNLAKSLLVIWMMTVMVVVIAIFCSTFLSWPIAFVLTIVLLLSHWAIVQLSDSLGSGLGRSVVNDFRVQDQAVAKTLSEGVNLLSNGLASVSQLLPDTSRFDAIQDIEHGNALPLSNIGEAAWVLAMFGMPSIVFAYLILRAKEVAP